MLTIDQLRSLTAIIETGSFRKAAEKLGKSQSTVSYSIKSLEEELGVKLFNVDRQKISLTESGRLVHQRGAKIVEESQTLKKICHLNFGTQLELLLHSL